VIDGSKTSVSLEDQFWEVLREIATERGTTLTGLITSIDRDRRRDGSSSSGETGRAIWQYALSTAWL
jgi:predicted DNA-binding ribbon-helix-helix protein